MKALLLKDYCVLWKQLRFFLLFILIFSALPGGFNGVFAVTLRGAAALFLHRL